ncbi:hypothetical protein [Roseisolibacter sp. H3M3-2]|uniref:hypothetical protein n=1 Tax=Roseisolibacter sp. H3M3-2 TaxID=3031323 RepID=UPI0023DC8833|nr:hypothetical protein [Roseisolibacter sp. H3M3-2]MDF1501808.1 hypothetical protein [Roseisolibacter sp. H3M3-2]
MSPRHAYLAMIALPLLASCAQEDAGVRVRMRPAEEAALARLADSLAALDPATELRHALAGGDRRFVAVCYAACEPIGVADSVQARLREGDTRVVSGTSDNVVSKGQRRVNAAADTFALRYNRLLLRELRQQSPD